MRRFDRLLNKNSSLLVQNSANSLRGIEPGTKHLGGNGRREAFAELQIVDGIHVRYWYDSLCGKFCNLALDVFHRAGGWEANCQIVGTDAGWCLKVFLQESIHRPSAKGPPVDLPGWVPHNAGRFVVHPRMVVAKLGDLGRGTLGPVGLVFFPGKNSADALAHSVTQELSFTEPA